jgi:hypothetical protein
VGKVQYNTNTKIFLQYERGNTTSTEIGILHLMHIFVMIFCYVQDETFHFFKSTMLQVQSQYCMLMVFLKGTLTRKKCVK